jgi:hypothetical protein
MAPRTWLVFVLAGILGVQTVAAVRADDPGFPAPTGDPSILTTAEKVIPQGLD